MPPPSGILLIRTNGEMLWRRGRSGPREDVISDWDEIDRTWTTYRYESTEDWDGETVDRYTEVA